MSAITWDSPVASVVGGRPRSATPIDEGLGLDTVGDLLRHYPRRYVETGRAHRPRRPARRASSSRVVGEVVRPARSTAYQDRRTGGSAYRLEVRVTTDGPRLPMTFFDEEGTWPSWQQRRIAPGSRGLFSGKVERFSDDLAADQPADR